MRTILIAIIGVLGLVVQANAQSEIELYPGVTQYGTPGVGTRSTEIVPGVRQFSGDYEGRATQVYPGVTQYNSNNLDAELADHVARDLAHRRAIQQEYENRSLRERVDRLERELRR